MNKRVLRGPQPETVKAYAITAHMKKDNAVKLVELKDNYQRLCRHGFDSIQTFSVRIKIHATNGAKEARIYEIRCYR